MGDDEAGGAGSRELRSVGSHEWVQIVRRMRCDGLIPAKGKRGGVSGLAFKGVALVLASHGNGVTGTRVRPGDGSVAVLAETSMRTVKLVKAKLVELGLLTRVRVGGRRIGGTDEYQLTLPSDLFDVVEVLDPDQVTARGQAMAAAFRGGSRGSGGPPRTDDAKQVAGDPVDPLETVDNSDVGGPVDPLEDATAEASRGSTGPWDARCRGSSGQFLGGPPDPLTKQDQPMNFTNHPDEDLRTDLTVVGATTPIEDPNLAVGVVGSVADAPADRRPWGLPPPPDAAARVRRGAALVRQATTKREPDADEAPDGYPSLRLVVEAAS